MNNTPDYVILNPTGVYGQIYYHGYYYYPQYFDNSVNKYYHHYPYYNRYYDNSNSFYENKPPGFDFNINPNISRVGRESGSCLLPASQRKADVLDYKQRNTLNILTKQQRWAQIAKGINNIGKKSWSSQTDTISTPNTSKLYLVGNTLTCTAPLEQDISGGGGGGGGGVIPPTPPSYTETSVNIPSTYTPAPVEGLNFSITSTYDMKAIFVSMYDNKIYSSYDYGLTWTALTTMNAKWSCIASSKTGSLVVAAKYNNDIFISTDTNHTTWTSTPSSEQQWTSVKISEKGQMIAATANMGNIYISTDVGNTWTLRENSRAWKKIALSYDGSILAAVVYGGYIYVSYDGGNNWMFKDSPRQWSSIAMSSSGLYMCAVENGGRIYVSKNYGNEWTAVEQVRQWYDVEMSKDGNIIGAINRGGKIYISNDCGSNWTAFSSNRNWYRMTMSYDGTMMTNCVFNENVYGEKYYLSLIV
jgi:hypothetical protein